MHIHTHAHTHTQTHEHLHISTLSDSVSPRGEIVAKITSSPTEQQRTPQFQKHYSKRWQDIFVSQLNRRQTRSEGRQGAPERLERPINHRSDINHVSSNVVMLHAIPKGTSKLSINTQNQLHECNSSPTCRNFSNILARQTQAHKCVYNV